MKVLFSVLQAREEKKRHVTGTDSLPPCRMNRTCLWFALISLELYQLFHRFWQARNILRDTHTDTHTHTHGGRDFHYIRVVHKNQFSGHNNTWICLTKRFEQDTNYFRQNAFYDVKCVKAGWEHKICSKINNSFFVQCLFLNWNVYLHEITLPRRDYKQSIIVIIVLQWVMNEKRTWSGEIYTVLRQKKRPWVQQGRRIGVEAAREPMLQ